jgi:RimJ/RimL family protein N-acetyltransferase
VTGPDAPGTPRVRIVQLDLPALRALAEGDLAAANGCSPVPLTEAFLDPRWRSVWQRRAEQVAADPATAAWVTGVVWDVDRRIAVGRAGFHAPPDECGMVEVGYAVDPEHRRRGYARAALLLLLDRAAREPAVRVVRATIGPANTPSRRLVEQHGFLVVGEQMDDEDGLEIVYELPA